MAETDGGESIDGQRAAFVVALPLHLDVRVVAERGDRRSLRGRRDHETGVFPGLDEILDQRGIAGVEADPHAREVRTLRQAVHREHTVEPAGEDRVRLRGELDVALVARNDDAVGAAPLGDPLEVRGVGDRRRRVARLVDPQQQRAIGVVGVDRVEVEVPVGVERHRHRALPGERRAHLVRRVRNRRVENGVEIGASQREEMRERDDHLLRTDARGDVRRRHVDSGPPGHPRGGRFVQRRRSAEGGYPIDRGAASAAAAATRSGTGSHGVPIEQSTTPPGSASATAFRASSRSYGYGGGTNGTTVAIASEPTGAPQITLRFAVRLWR